MICECEFHWRDKILTELQLCLKTDMAKKNFHWETWRYFGLVWVLQRHNSSVRWPSFIVSGARSPQVWCREAIINQKGNSPGDSPACFAPLEDLCDTIRGAHVAIGHGGRDRLLTELIQKYANVSTLTVVLYKARCEECHKQTTNNKNKK